MRHREKLRQDMREKERERERKLKKLENDEKEDNETKRQDIGKSEVNNSPFFRNRDT